MNNKGFAITTILYGTLILFCLLLVSLLGILATYRNNLDKLVNSTNGTRDIVGIITKKPTSEMNQRGLYCTDINDNTTCRYYKTPES